MQGEWVHHRPMAATSPLTYRAMVLRERGAPLSVESRPVPDPRVTRCCCASRPAPSAAPTCTWSTANWTAECCRSCRATRSSAGSIAAGPAPCGWVGDRVGVPGWRQACGSLRPCAGRAARTSARGARFTGYQIDGGFAEYAVADARFCFRLPDGYTDVAGGAAAVRRPHRLPRARAMAGDARAAGHLRVRRRRPHRRPGGAPAGPRGLRVHPARATRRRRPSPAALRRGLGRGSDEPPPEPLDAAIIFAPVGALVPAALRARRQGRHRGLRRHPHERHPRFPLRAALGGARSARSPT